MKNIISDLGEIKIHSALIRQIVEIAASSVEGVYSLAASPDRWIAGLISRITTLGIRLDLTKDLKIEVPIIVKQGYNIPEVASRVQEEILKNLAKSLNIDTAYIVVKVKGLKK
jgi:uncharacterized alkaline shock family protein YloU